MESTWGKQVKAIDSYILTIFGIHGGRKLTLTLGLVPTDKEDLEQRQFEKTNVPEHIRMREVKRKVHISAQRNGVNSVRKRKHELEPTEKVKPSTK